MRMWMVPPSLMCNQHLLGEHCEHHMFVGTLLRGTSIKGYIKNNLVEPISFWKRHDELVTEMLLRNMKHQSILPTVDVMIYMHIRIDSLASKNELMHRCPRCRERIEAHERRLTI